MPPKRFVVPPAGSLAKTMSVQPSQSTLDQSMAGMDVELPSQRPRRRSSAPAVNRARTQPLTLDHFLDNLVSAKKPAKEPVVPPTSPRQIFARPRNKRKSLPDVKVDVLPRGRHGRRWSDVTCDWPYQSCGSRRSESPSDQTPRMPAAQSRRCSGSSVDRTPRLPAAAVMHFQPCEQPQST